MVNKRDAITIRPNLVRDERAATGTHARERAKEERRLAGTKRKKGLVHRLLQIRGARQAGHLTRRVIVGKTARAPARGLGRGIFRGGRIARLAASPVGLALAGLAVAIVVGTRLASGKSFENMGAQLNKILLGDMDDEARANRTTREQITGNEDLARIIGIEGEVNPQIADLWKDLRHLNLENEKGRSLFMEDPAFQVNNTLDMIILRARSIIMNAFNAAGGAKSVEEFARKLVRFKMTTGR